VTRLAAVVDELQRADLSGLEDASLVEALRAFETQRRRLEAVDQRLLAQAAQVRLPASCAAATLGGVLSQVLLVDPREARLRESRAYGLGPRRTLTGEPLAPALPALSAALAAGEVSVGQADVILEAVENIPDRAPAGAAEVVERVLVEAAHHETPRRLRRTAHELLERLDTDGREPADEARERRRGFHLAAFPNGWSRPSGRFSPELTAVLQSVLDSLAAPVKQDREPDPRSAGQRRHDGLLEALTRVLRSGTLPECGGVPVTVLATISVSELAAAVGHAQLPRPEPEPPSREASCDLGLSGLAAEAGIDLAELLATPTSGLALLGHGQIVSVPTLLRMAAEAEVIPVVLSDAGGVLAYGRERRLATKGQRLALAARDGGCCFPGCDRPASWTEVHHVVEWLDDGPTDLDNMCLLCVHHHRWFPRAGWRVEMREGVPVWFAPLWLDPDQTPRRNTVHHLKEIVFRRPAAA